jgi:DNA-binding MarR family transcriptional regulator
MEKDNFTPVERKVLVALMAHQHEPDRAIAESLGMAPSNFVVVKKRLKSKGVLLEQIRVDMHALREAKVAGFVWLEYNRSIRGQFREELDRIRSNFPVAYTYGGSDWSLNVDYFRTFEDAEDVRLKLAEYLQRKLASYLSNYMWKIVPLSHLTTQTFKRRLVENSLLRKEGGAAATGDVRSAPLLPDKIPALNSTEKKILVALRRFPNLSKGEIAEKVGITRSSLSEPLKRLHKKGVISYGRTVDPAKLPGCEVAAFAWIDLRQPMLGSQEEKAVGAIIKMAPLLFKLHHTKTFVLVNAFCKSFDGAESLRNGLMELFGSNIKVLDFKIVPRASLTMEYTPYFLEHLFGVHYVPAGTPLGKERQR